MSFQIELEKPSDITRKFKIKVPASIVAKHFEKGLAEVQRTAKLKGFRPGHAPISIIRQQYGEDVRHQVYHSLIDESYRAALKEHKVAAVGSPKIESPEHKHGEGEHDHGVQEDKDFSYIATVEVLPEIEVKGYTGVSLTKEKVEITDEAVTKIIDNLRNSRAELTPVSGGLVGADGKPSSRPVKKNDFVEMDFAGGLVTDTGIEEKPGMKGKHTLEVGSNSFIPGFEDNLEGMRAGETKTFRVTFPKDYHEKDFQDKQAEFTVTVHEVKEKKLPELDEAFMKEIGYDSIDAMKAAVRDHLTQEKTDEVSRKLRSDLLQTLIDKNKFEVPGTLIESQTRMLAQEWAQELKQHGYKEEMVQGAIIQELPNLKKRAESQVRASLILEAISKQENIQASEADFEVEMKKSAEGMKVEIEKIQEYYTKNPGRKEDFMFRLRQDRTVQMLLDKAKIKEK